MASTVGGHGVTGSLAAVIADDRAFRAWYDAALPHVYAYLFHRCGRDPELAQELTQQTFVDAIRSRSIAPDGAGVAWLIGIARHKLADHFRGRSGGTGTSRRRAGPRRTTRGRRDHPR